MQVPVEMAASPQALIGMLTSFSSPVHCVVCVRRSTHARDLTPPAMPPRKRARYEPAAVNLAGITCPSIGNFARRRSGGALGWVGTDMARGLAARLRGGR